MSTALTRADGQTVSETLLVGLRSQFILAICSMSVFVCVCVGVRVHCECTSCILCTFILSIVLLIGERVAQHEFCLNLLMWCGCVGVCICVF